MNVKMHILSILGYGDSKRRTSHFSSPEQWPIGHTVM
jgi:hypothetical protein